MINDTTSQEQQQQEPNGTSDQTNESELSLESAFAIVENDCAVRRVKHGRIGHSHMVKLSSSHNHVEYIGSKMCIPHRFKRIATSEILEIREGWNTDDFHRAAKLSQYFSRKVDEKCCLR